MNNVCINPLPPSESVRTLSDSALHDRLLGLVANERRLHKLVVEHIAEVDRRRLYLPMAYASLFDYLVEGLGYSPASAQRRIDAARLLQQIPELTEKIETGSLKLSQISQLQKALRERKRETKQDLSLTEKRALVERIENKSAPATEALLAQTLDLPVKTAEKQRAQKDLSVRLECTSSFCLSITHKLDHFLRLTRSSS